MFWQELVHSFDKNQRTSQSSNDAKTESPFVVYWDANPLIMKEDFVKNFMKNLPAHFKTTSDQFATLPSDFVSQLTIAKEFKEIGVENLQKAQNNITDSNTVDLMSPAEHLEMLKNFVNFPDAKKGQGLVFGNIKAFIQFILVSQLQRQAQPPTNILHTRESLQSLAWETQSLEQVMSEQAAAGKDIFRKSTFEEQMLASALGNLTIGHSENQANLVERLELVLEVYLSGLEKASFKLEERFSQAQMQIMASARKIADRLTVENKDDSKGLNLMVRGLLMLAILTGDVCYLLKLAQISEKCDSETQFDVSDLLAVLITIAKKYYFENTPKKQADQMSAIAGLNSSRARTYKIADSQFAKMISQNQKLLWTDDAFYVIDESLNLQKLNGTVGASSFGQAISEPIQLESIPTSVRIKEVQGTSRLSIVQANSEFGHLQCWVIKKPTWQELLNEMKKFVNDSVLQKKQTLVDVSVTVQHPDEGGRLVGWVLYDSGKIDLNPANTKKLELLYVTEKSTWDNIFQKLEQKIKSKADRFFKHFHSPNKADDGESKVMGVWYWSTKQTDLKQEDIKLDFFKSGTWQGLINKAEIPLQDRRILDVKTNCAAKGGDAQLSIVSVKEPGSHGLISCNFEKFRGPHEEIALKITDKAQKQQNFASCSMCPRDTNHNDEKVTISVTFNQLKEKKNITFIQMKTKVFIFDNLENVFEPLMAFVNAELQSGLQAFAPIDIGFSVQTQGEGGQAVGYVVYDDQAFGITYPGSRLKLIVKEHTGSWEDAFEWLDEQIKLAGDNYFKHHYSPLKHNHQHKMCAVWVWEGEIIEELKNSYPGIQLHTFKSMTWDDAAQKAEAVGNQEGLKTIDAKITCSAAGSFAWVTLVTISSPNITGRLILNKVNRSGNYETVLKSTISDQLTQVRYKGFAGISVCQRDTNKNDEKVTICAEYFEFEDAIKDKQTETIYDLSSLAVLDKRPFTQEIVQLKDFYAFDFRGEPALFGFKGSEMVLELKKFAPLRLKSPLKFQQSDFVSVSDADGFLLLQFKGYLVSYCWPDLELASLRSQACEPFGFKEINPNIVDSRLIFKADSSDFVFVHKANQLAVGFDSLDDALDPSKLTDLQQTTSLQGFGASVEEQCKQAQRGFHLLKETQCFDLFNNLFKSQALPNRHRPSILGKDLDTLMLELVARLIRLQQAKLVDSRLYVMFLTHSPFTLGQPEHVWALLKNIFDRSSSASLPNRIRAVCIFIDHLLVLRQKGMQLDNLSIPAEMPLQLLKTLIEMHKSVDELEPAQHRSAMRKEVNQCQQKFLSLMNQHVLLCAWNPEVHRYPAVLGTCKLTEHQKPFDYNLPKDFVASAVGLIKLKQIKYCHNNIDLQKVVFVLSNGVKEIETSAFGQTSSALQTYEIKNDRQWTRALWRKHENAADVNRWPFSQMSFKFDGALQGCVYTNSNVCHETVVETLEENEIITGFHGYVDRDTGILRSVAMKTTKISKKSNIREPLFTFTKAQIDSIEFNEHFPRTKLILQLMNIQLPNQIKGHELQEFESEMKDYLVQNFEATQGHNFETALAFLNYFASQAMRVKDATQLTLIKELFELTVREAIERPERCVPNSIGHVALKTSSQIMLATDFGEFTKFAISYIKQLSAEHVDKQSKQQFFNTKEVFEIFALLVCSQSKQLLIAPPEVLPKLENQQANEQAVIVEQINRSDLLSGGLAPRHMNLCSQKTLQIVKHLQQFTGIDIVGSSLAVSTFDPEPELDEHSKICQAIINEGEISRVDDIVKALQQIALKTPALRSSAMIGGAIGFKLTRCAFAVMIKLAGMAVAVQSLIQLLDLEEDSMMIPKERVAREQAIMEIIQDDSISPKLIKLWKISTKMRFWLQQEKMRNAVEIEKKIPMEDVPLTEEEKLGLNQEEINQKEKVKADAEQERVSELREKEEEAMLARTVANIESKAKFLFRLETPESFKTPEPDQEIEYQTSFLKYPSYFEMKSQNSSDNSLLPSKESQGSLQSHQSVWHNKFSEWKQQFEEQGKFRSRQEKLAEVRESGTTSVLACLQTNITTDQIQERVELNFTNAARRLAGLSLLQTFLRFVTSFGKSRQVDRYVLQAINVLCSSLQVDKSKMFHYLDDVPGCGNFLENALRTTFFATLQLLMQHHSEHLPPAMMPCFQWNFKARDFKFLIQLKVLKQLMWGKDNNGIFQHLGVAQTLDLKAIDHVVKAHQFEPESQTTNSLLFTFVDLFLSIMARLAEESEKREEIGIQNKEGKQEMTIQKSMSVVDTSECQLLLSQAFSIVFREFEIFLDCTKEIHAIVKSLKEMPKVNEVLKLQQKLVEAVNKRKYHERNPEAKHDDETTLVETEQIQTESVQQPIKEQEAQEQVAVPVVQVEDDSVFCGLFGQEDDLPDKKTQEEKKPMSLLQDSHRAQELVNAYRSQMQAQRIQSMMSLIGIFVNIATQSAYPLQLMQNVANPAHIQTLLKLFVEATSLLKIQILHILKNLLLIKIPTEVFTSGLKGINSPFQTQVIFKNALAQLLYQHAVQMRSKKWESAYESVAGGLYDVLVHITRTIALCLKQDQIRAKTNESAELTAIFERISTYSAEERDVLFHIVGAHYQRFVHKDLMLDVTANKLTRFSRKGTKSEFAKQTKTYMQSFMLCPEKNDAHLQLVLGKSAIQALIQNLMSQEPLAEESKEATSELANTVFKGHILKLLCLQHSTEETKFDTIIDPAMRCNLINCLLEQGLESIEGLSSKKLQGFQTQSEKLASAKTLRFLEFVMNFIETKDYDTYHKVNRNKDPIVVMKDSHKPVLANNLSQSASSDNNSSGTQVTDQLQITAKKKKSKNKNVRAKQMLQKEQPSSKVQQATPQQNVKRALMNSIFAQIHKGKVLSQEEISLMTAKVCDFIDTTGITLPEVVFGLFFSSLPKENIKNAQEVYLQMMQEIYDHLESATNKDEREFRLEKKLTDYLLEKLHTYFSMKGFSIEQLDEQLESIDVQSVRDVMGPILAELRTKVKQAVFHRLANYSAPNFEAGIERALKSNVKTEDLASAQKMFSLQQNSLEEIEDFLQAAKVDDIADSFQRQMAAKLLFQLLDCDKDFDQKENSSLNLKQNMKLLTVLVNHFANVQAELSTNYSVSSIWECRFRPHIAKMLTLNRLQVAGDEAEGLELYEGSQQNIHQVMSSVCFPTVDDLRSRVIGTLLKLQQKRSGAEQVHRLIQSQIIDKFTAKCMQSNDYIGVQHASLEALRPLSLAEDLQKQIDEDMMAENFIGIWFVHDRDGKHVFSFNVFQSRTVVQQVSESESKNGTWRILQKNQGEIVVGPERFVLDLQVDQRTCVINKDSQTFTAKRIMDPMQFLGEWSWCHDGQNRECELIFNGKRGGQSGGSPHTYWQLKPDFTVYVGRLNNGDRHIFKIVDDNTLEILEPKRDPPTRCLRVTEIPKRQKPILQPEQLVGQWNWCHDGVNPSHSEPHVLYKDGSIKNDGNQPGLWKMEPDGMVFIGRLNASDRHIFKIIDKNTLEIIEPKRNPPTLMKRVGKAPQSKYGQNFDNKLKISQKNLEVNSLIVGLAMQSAKNNEFWQDLLPQLFEMFLFQLGHTSKASKIRLLLEQCSCLLQLVGKNFNHFGSSQMPKQLIASPILQLCLKIATTKCALDGNNENLVSLLLADLRLQQLQIAKALENSELQEMYSTKTKTTKIGTTGIKSNEGGKLTLRSPLQEQMPKTVEYLSQLQNQFVENDQSCIETKKHFLMEYWASLPQLQCWNKHFVLSSSEETKQTNEHEFGLQDLKKFKKVILTSQNCSGNEDVVMCLIYGQQYKYASLKEKITWNVHIDPDSALQIKFILPDRHLRAVHLNKQAESSNDLTLQGQLIESFNESIDRMICQSDFSTFYWCKNYSVVIKQIDNHFTPVSLPKAIQNALSQERDADWKPPALKIQCYDGLNLILFEGQVHYVKSGPKTFDIDGHKIIDFAASKHSALFVTEGGQLYETDLLCLGGAEPSANCEIKKVDSSLFQDLSDDVQFTRCWMQTNSNDKNDRKGYALVEVVIKSLQQVKFFSFGINANGCLANGLDPSKKTEGFTPVVDDFQGTPFDQLFLSPNAVLAVDVFGVLWSFGGKFNFKDELYFPASMNEVCNFPLKTSLMEFLQKQFGPDVLISCKQVVMSPTQIVVLIETNNTATSTIQTICYSISKLTSNNNCCDINPLCFDGQSVLDVGMNDVNAFVLLKKEPNFSLDYQIEIAVQPDFDNSITTDNSDDILQKVLPEWQEFRKKMQTAFDTQFVFDVLQRVNDYMAMNPKAMENFPKQIEESQIELKGEVFSTDDDRKLARVIVHKLLLINADQKGLFESRIDQTFSSDPFTFVSPGLGSQTTCRNWSAALKSKKRFLIDKLLEQQFKAIVQKLPTDDRGRIEISVNRYAARRFCDSGKIDFGDGDTVFSQVMKRCKQDDPNYTAWRKNSLNSAVFRANFLHEGSIDAGGPYRECHEQMCREVLSGALPLLVPTENQRNAVGEMREAFMLNSDSISEAALHQFFLMGLWIGNAIRTGAPLSLSLHPVIWKRLIGQEEFSLRDLKYVDYHKYSELVAINDIARICTAEEEFSANVEQTFTVTFGSGDQRRTVELCNQGYSKAVTLGNYEEYLSLAVNAILKKDELQMAQFKKGVYHVLSKEAMHACSWTFAQVRACGKQTIDMQLLRKHSSFQGIDGKPFEDVFWKVLEEFSEADKRLYLKFVTGRAKMPLDIGSQSYQHTVTKMGGNDSTLPQAHICYNQIDLPAYTKEEFMRKRLLTAIQFCGEVDTDGVRHADY